MHFKKLITLRKRNINLGERNLISEALLGTSNVLFELGARRAERVHVLLVQWTAAVAHNVGELLRVRLTRNLVLVLWPAQMNSEHRFHSVIHTDMNATYCT